LESLTFNPTGTIPARSGEPIRLFTATESGFRAGSTHPVRSKQILLSAPFDWLRTTRPTSEYFYPLDPNSSGAIQTFAELIAVDQGGHSQFRVLKVCWALTVGFSNGNCKQLTLENCHTL